MSAGNSWFDGLHLADTAGYAVVEALSADAEFADAMAARILGPEDKNGKAGVVEVRAGERKWIVSVVEA